MASIASIKILVSWLFPSAVAVVAAAAALGFCWTCGTAAMVVVVVVAGETAAARDTLPPVAVVTTVARVTGHASTPLLA